jgi:hypothetical protein
VYISPIELRLEREYRLLLKNRSWQSTHSHGNMPKKYIKRSFRGLVLATRRVEFDSHFGHSGFIGIPSAAAKLAYAPYRPKRRFGDQIVR